MKRKQLLVILAVAGMSLLVILPEIGSFPDFKYTQDAKNYIRMAEGHPKDVLLHHARRMLHPWIVGQLRWIAGTDAAFLIVGILSLFVFLWVVTDRLFREQSYPLTACAGFIFLPYLFILFDDLYIQTLFFLALSAVFWLAIMKKRYWLGVMLLFPMSLTRDETIIIAAALVAVIILKKQNDLPPKRAALFSAGMLATTGGGAVLTSLLTRSNTNINHLSQFLFSVIRLPLFLIENLTGFRHWLSTYQALPEYTHSPMVSFDLPAWLHKISVIKQAGIYEWDPLYPAAFILLLLSAFGTGPTILYFLLKKTRFRDIRGSLVLNAMLLFGGLVFILAPTFGPPILRYFVYAWPAFFLVLPVLLKKFWAAGPAEMRKLLLVYFLSGWLCAFTPRENGLLLMGLAIAVEIPFHIYTWRRLQAVFGKTAAEPAVSCASREFDY